MRAWPPKLEKVPSAPTAFLDRDGTITRDKAGVYVTKPAQLKVYASAPAALKEIAAKGYRLVVITNQSGVARGYMTLRDAKAINLKLVRELRRSGVRLAAVYMCPHGPHEGCACRKPAPGLLMEAAAELPWDLSRSFVAGDKRSDLELARRAGLKGRLVLTGQGKAALPEAPKGYRDLAALAKALPDLSKK